VLRPVPRWSTKTTGDAIAEGKERRCQDRGVRLGRGAQVRPGCGRRQFWHLQV
jgi:hypothetical protein